jgi:branched-chain amino acid transport system ATP-binding protein
MTLAVRTDGLVKRYDGTLAVAGVDLEIAPGEIHGLVGPNGAGKTTTLLTIAGELPPLGGDLRVLGCRGRDPLHTRARHGLGLVTQERAVLMELTVDENLRVGRCDRERALELFPELEPHLDRRVALLSGGQQQMLALARSLARDLKLLVVDELSLGLGPIVVDRLLQVVRTAADEGIGVLLVEQHVHKAMQFADRMLVLRRGVVELAGTVAELRGRLHEIQDAYLRPEPGGAAP